MDTEWADLRGQTSYSPERFTEAVYQQVVAGMPRLAGALAALEYFGVPDAERRAARYAAVKQEHLVKLIEAGEFTAFADAIRFVLAVKAAGIPSAAASSSKNHRNRYLSSLVSDGMRGVGLIVVSGQGVSQVTHSYRAAGVVAAPDGGAVSDRDR